MISLDCGGCGQKLQVQNGLAGKRVKCPKCGNLALVPAATETATLPPLTSPVAAQAKAGLEATQFSALSPEPARVGAAANRADFDFLAPPQAPGEIGRLGSYRVLKVLGAGGMGVVFLAEDMGLERLVALKAVKP